MKKCTGLYLNLLTHEIQEEVILVKGRKIKHHPNTAKLTYLGMKHLLPSVDVLIDNAPKYCSIFTKELLPTWLQSKHILFDRTNMVVACYENGDIVSTMGVYTLDYDLYLDIFRGLNKEIQFI